MDNLILIALTAFSVKTGEDFSLPAFQHRFTELVRDLQENIDDIYAIFWFDEFRKTVKMEDELEFQNAVDSFFTLLSEYGVTELLHEAGDIRQQFLIEAAPRFNHPPRKFMCTYTIEFEDETHVDYICRPFGIPSAINVDMLARLTHLFADQFVESSIFPGLDVFHDQSAKQFSAKKFEELMTVLDKYINSMDSNEREPYRVLTQRLSHRFSLDPELKPPQSGDLHFLSNGGGFKRGETKNE